jgi:hypothetical protein
VGIIHDFARLAQLWRSDSIGIIMFLMNHHVNKGWRDSRTHSSHVEDVEKCKNQLPEWHESYEDNAWKLVHIFHMRGGAGRIVRSFFHSSPRVLW